MIRKCWGEFNILTKDHFYHNGANIENRRGIVEALVCNFDVSAFDCHNYEAPRMPKARQLEFDVEYA